MRLIRLILSVFLRGPLREEECDWRERDDGRCSCCDDEEPWS